MKTDLILGTAGHIDHGKTSLIRALTGVDTDRLPEEKRRGITIDLGFAFLELDNFRLGIVDVPGHERLVRNMLAGATGMDLVLLVVAADDSVKPQTREHLEILRLLNMPAGVIALTKCDLADTEWTDLVEQEVREVVSETFLADAPLIRTSATTGDGLEELRSQLSSAAEKATAQRISIEDSPFRMAIDRSFTVPGHGTVVTGSIASGAAKIGEQLVVQPGGFEVRIRSLQSHDREVDQVQRGQRAAMNLSGIHHNQVQRGQQVALPGHLIPTRRITVTISLLPSAPRPLKHRARVRMHLGTAEHMVGVSLLDRPLLKPGQSCIAQMLLGHEAVASWKQPFVIRSESPITTIGGGHVLNVEAPRIRRNDERVIHLAEQLVSNDDLQRGAAATFFAGLKNWLPKDLGRMAGIKDANSIYNQLVNQEIVTEIVVSPTRTLRVHSQIIIDFQVRVTKILQKLHQEHPLQVTFERSQILSHFSQDQLQLLDHVLNQMTTCGEILRKNGRISLAGHGPKLSKNERILLDELIDIYRQTGEKPPTVSECRKQATRLQNSVAPLIALASSNGDLIELTSEIYMHSEAELRLRERIGQELRGSGGLTLSQMREILETTRKYAVPLAEYWDRTGFTRRDGDLRTLAENLATGGIGTN